VTVSGLFVKQLSGSDDETGQNKPAKLFVAKRVTWHPTTPREPAVSLGMSVLGSLGMDVGLLDQIRSHGPLHRGDTAAFYEMLGAAGRIGANQLIRFANGNLDVVRRQWEQEASTASDEMRRELGNEVVRLANEGRYSFALLYNDAKRQIGQLVVFDGTARRVVRIDVGSRDEDGAPSAVARRFGIDHYYELHVFTDDSQNYPLVCCMRELPTGLPTGDDLHVPVRVAGFFFKDWLYTTRGTRDLDTGELDLQNGKRQHAPLLVGRAPVLLQLEEKSGAGQLVGGGLFLLALGGIWAAAWWLSRQDRRVAERRRTAVHSLPPGQSLNDLTIPPADEPVSVEGEVRTEDDRRT
jgi:hypothetical protein